MYQSFVNLPHYGRRVRLMALRGCHEMALTGADTANAVELLADLVCDAEGDAIEAAALTAGERDRLLGALWQKLFGDRIYSTVQCRECDEKFDVDFLLSDLLGAVFGDGESTQPGPYHRLGCSFRLPVGHDEMAVAGLDPGEALDELVDRCVIDGECDDAQQLVESFEQLSPVVDTQLSASCAECGHDQQIGFDLQDYVLTAIANERSQLLFEVHALARSYGWNLEEILELPRTDRKSLVRLATMETDRGAR